MKRSPLRWVGGKTQLVDQIVPFFPIKMQNYYEPFVGSGVILFEVIRKREQGDIQMLGDIIVNDINKGLINFYKWFQREASNMIATINELEFNYNSLDNVRQKEYYYALRTKYNATIDTLSVDNAIYFYMINHLCYRGLYREGSRGFNTSFGFATKMTITDPDEFMYFSRLIEGVKFYNQPYDEFVRDNLTSISRNDVMYLDPPYFKSYNRYHSSKFDVVKFVDVTPSHAEILKSYLLSCGITIH